MNEFEQKLQRQPMRQVPDAWRAEIMSAAESVQAVPPAATVPSRPFFATVKQQLSALLWPNQLAWGGLAAIWIFILALNFSMQEKSPVLARQASRPTAEIMMDWHKNQRLLAELIGPREDRVADRSNNYNQHPRSQYMELFVA